jgi:hypothetical protein
LNPSDGGRDDRQLCARALKPFPHASFLVILGFRRLVGNLIRDMNGHGEGAEKIKSVDARKSDERARIGDHKANIDLASTPLHTTASSFNGDLVAMRA